MVEPEDNPKNLPIYDDVGEISLQIPCIADLGIYPEKRIVESFVELRISHGHVTVTFMGPKR